MLVESDIPNSPKYLDKVKLSTILIAIDIMPFTIGDFVYLEKHTELFMKTDLNDWKIKPKAYPNNT